MRASRWNPTFVWALVTGLVGCGGSRPPPARADAVVSSQPAPAASIQGSGPVPSERKPPSPEPAETPDVALDGAPLGRHMQAHFEEALLIRQAVIAGKPENAREPALALARLREADQFPESWRGFVDRMREVAGRIEESTLVSRAATATADLGVTCGLCHQQRGGPEPSKEPAPDEGTSVESRMQRHVWATERLWEGLYVPSDDAWEGGAKALSTAPFPSELLKEGDVYARTAARDFARLAVKAPAKRTPRDRAELYAELLSTCGSCHRVMKTSH